MFCPVSDYPEGAFDAMLCSWPIARMNSVTVPDFDGVWIALGIAAHWLTLGLTNALGCFQPALLA